MTMHKRSGVCPKCKSDDVTGNSVVVEETRCLQPCHCGACGYLWTARYSLVAQDDVEDVPCDACNGTGIFLAHNYEDPTVDVQACDTCKTEDECDVTAFERLHEIVYGQSSGHYSPMYWRGESYPVGTLVHYWKGLKHGEPSGTAKTQTEIQMLGGHTAVVWVEGEPACIAMTHIKKARK